MEMLEAQRQYQDLLEAHRRDPDDEATWDELQKARAVRDEAWSIHNVGQLVKL